MKRLIVLGLSLLIASATAHRAAETDAGQGETLTLEQALALASQNNRQVKSAILETQKSEESLDAARTRLLPAIQFNAIGSLLLEDVQFDFPKGAFGDLPVTGPIPPKDTSVTSTSDFTTFLNASVRQPLTQLYRARLGVQLAKSSHEADQEKLRAARQAVARDVKRAYCGILQTQSALAASDEALAFYQELDRVVADRVARQTALQADALDVKARLAAEQYSALTLRNALASGKERLNDLMGRDPLLDFQVVALPEPTGLETDLEAARSRALDQRPEMREARLRLSQADLDRRIKKAELIPDLSVGYNYLSNQNIDVLPRNFSSVQLLLSWEPFTWGRRRSEVAEKERAVEQATLAADDARSSLLMEVDARHRALQESRALIQAAQIAHDAARERARIATDRYRHETALLKDVLQAQSDLADAGRKYQEAVLGFWTAKADFDKALGDEP